MKPSTEQKDKAWKYALGMIKIDGLKPSDEFLALVEKEKNGEISTTEISQVLHRQYQMKKTANVSQ